MFSAQELEKFHKASKIIEAEGTHGFDAVSKIVGAEVAIGMFVMYLRNQEGADKTFPSDPNAVGKVNNILQSNLIAV